MDNLNELNNANNNDNNNNNQNNNNVDPHVLNNNNNVIQNDNNIVNNDIVNNNIVNNENNENNVDPNVLNGNNNLQNQRQNPEQNQQNLQNQQPVQNENQQEQPAAENEVEVAEGRELLDKDAAVVRGKAISGDLKDAKLFMRGSKEFDNARSKYDRVQKLWEEFSKKEHPTTAEVERMRGEVMNAMHMADRYLEKKDEEKDASKNAKNRVSQMEKAFGHLEEQFAILNNSLEELAKEEAPSFGKLSLSGEDAIQQMKDAKLFLRGSKEYDNALEAFENAQKRLKELEHKYEGHEEDMPPTELEDCREEFRLAQGGLVKYLSKKDGDIIKENTHRRVDAVRTGHAVLEEAGKKMEQLMDKFDNSPARKTSKISEMADEAVEDLKAADEGVHFGSDEYKKAWEATEKSAKQLQEFKAKGDDYKPAFREMEEMRTNTDDALEKIDAYLATKKGKELSDKTQKRVDAMKKAKNAILETRRKFREMNKENMEKASEFREADLVTQENAQINVLREVRHRVDGRRVWFGSQEYLDGMNAYRDVCDKEERRGKKDLNEKELKDSLKEITEAQKTMQKYIQMKEKKIKEIAPKELDQKGKVRLAEMRKAYDQLAIRKARAEQKLETLTTKGKENQQKKIDNRVKEFDKNISGKTGSELVDAILVAEAAHTLQKYGKKRNLSSNEKIGIRRAIATLFLHEKLQGPEGATLKANMPRSIKGYSKQISEIANSKEFKAQFPDKEIKPDMVRKLMADPKEVKKALKVFDENAKKEAEKQAIKNKNGLKKNQNINKQEIEMQTFKK